MRSLVTVTVPASETDLTTLTRVKIELSITGTDANRDAVLEDKIAEASGDIEAALGFTVARETVTETFWLEPNDLLPQVLLLDRTPVISISGVNLDGDTTTYGASRYRLDPETGELFALDASGFPCIWAFCKSIIVTYVGGYLLPPQTGNTLPAAIEGACIELVSDFWAAKGRDPSLRSEDIPGLRTATYWVGAVGDESDLPPRVLMKLAPFRRAIA